MKILFVTECDLRITHGKNHRLFGTIKELRSLYDEIMIFCPESGCDVYCDAQVVHFPSCATPFSKEFGLYPMTNPELALHHIEKFHPDIVHFMEPLAKLVGAVF